MLYDDMIPSREEEEAVMSLCCMLSAIWPLGESDKLQNENKLLASFINCDISRMTFNSRQCQNDGSFHGQHPQGLRVWAFPNVNFHHCIRALTSFKCTLMSLHLGPLVEHSLCWFKGSHSSEMPTWRASLHQAWLAVQCLRLFLGSRSHLSCCWEQWNHCCAHLSCEKLRGGIWCSGSACRMSLNLKKDPHRPCQALKAWCTTTFWSAKREIFA